MIKKMISVFLIISLCLSIASCGDMELSSSESDAIPSTEESSAFYSENEPNTSPDKEKAEQIKVSLPSSSYYNSYLLDARDLVDKGFYGSKGICNIISSYDDLKLYIKTPVMADIDKSIFEDNIVCFVKMEISSSYVLGFRNLEYSGEYSPMKLYCDKATLTPLEPNNREESEVLDPIDFEAFIVAIPHDKVLGMDNNSKIEIVENEVVNYKARLAGYFDGLGNEEKIFILESSIDANAFKKEYGIENVYINFTSKTVILAHYIPRVYSGLKNIVYNNAKIDENGAYSVDCTMVYNAERQDEINIGALYFIYIPERLVHDKEANVTLNKKVEILRQTDPVNVDYTDYEYVIDILYGDECNSEHLPTEYGEYYWLSEDSTGSPCLIIYRYYEKHDYEIVGYHSIGIDGALQVSVDEYEVEGREGEYKSLSYVRITKEIKELIEKYSPTLALTSKKLEYYKKLGSPLYGTHPTNMQGGWDIYVANYYDEFVDFWRDFVGEDIFNAVDSDTFKTHFVVAVKGSARYGYIENSEIMYRNFYIDENGMHITEDVVIKYGEKTEEYDRNEDMTDLMQKKDLIYDEGALGDEFITCTDYSIILVPREIFDNAFYTDNAFYYLDLITNKIKGKYTYVYE